MEIAQKVAAKQEKLLAVKDSLVEIKSLLESDDAEEINEEQMARIEMLTEEQDALIKSIESLEAIEANLAKKAEPVQKAQAMNYGTSGAFPVQEKGGDLLAKTAAVKLIAHMEKKHPDQVMSERYGHDDRVKATFDYMNKAAVLPANTGSVGWATELVNADVQGFMRDLEPVSVYAALRSLGTSLDFGNASTITIPKKSDPNRQMQPAFVGEGGVIPVGRTNFGSTTLARYKVAIISDFTNELLQQSTPNIETLVRQAMLDDTAFKLDTALLDGVAAVNGVRPASIANGATITASSGGVGAVTSTSVIADLKVLLASMATANLGAKPVIIMNNAHLLGLSTMLNATGAFMFRDEIRSGTLLGIPVIASSNVAANSVFIVDSDSFVAVNATPEFMVSDQATIVQANADGTAPTQAGAATDYTGGAIGTAGEVPKDGGLIVSGNGAGAPTGASAAGYQALSMYQVYSTAIRMVLPTSWGLTRTGAVAGLSGVNW